jgi:uncharacterized membrane protein
MKNLLQHTLSDPRYVIGIVLLIHLVGLLALVSPFASLVLPLTPVNLLLTAGAMLLFSRLDKATIALALLLGTLGYAVEVIGVTTGVVFGEYAYGDVLGLKVLEVPLLIGLNWSMLVFAVGVPLNRLRMPVWGKVLCGSAAMVLLDLLIEPVAIRLGFWTWAGEVVPLRNYFAWGGISALFFSLFFILPVDRENPVAKYVLLAQVIFFGGLNLLSAF